ncbi:MAG: RecX family transcriptional regulator [Bacilli bacterium]|nr:RecX family transcriptional regulator [Bacilli bacterium]
MKIIKYKKCGASKYKLFLDDGRELCFYEDVILKFDFLLKKELTEKEMMEADFINQEWDVYYIALQNINHHMKSTYELRAFLERKEYPIELIDKAIDKLSKQGYLDDRNYAKSYIHYQIITTNKGPFRIEQELVDKKIPSKIIQEEMKEYTEEEQKERVQKLITKSIEKNRTREGVMLKQKIVNDLKTLGYDLSMIQEMIMNFSFPKNKELEEKEKEKTIRKYSRKFEGKELERKVREYLYRKGIPYEED